MLIRKKLHQGLGGLEISGIFAPALQTSKAAEFDTLNDPPEKYFFDLGCRKDKGTYICAPFPNEERHTIEITNNTKRKYFSQNVWRKENGGYLCAPFRTRKGKTKEKFFDIM